MGLDDEYKSCPDDTNFKPRERVWCVKITAEALSVISQLGYL
jgi:hypothetical protein